MYLTYYKSRKMEKLLAALSLPQIGEIKTIPAELDPERQIGLFSLELNTRIYTLRAKSDEEALLWVTTLNKIKQQGILATHNQVHQQANGGIQSLEVDSEEKKSETSADWLKTGRSCFGCC